MNSLGTPQRATVGSPTTGGSAPGKTPAVGKTLAVVTPEERPSGALAPPGGVATRRDTTVSTAATVRRRSSAPRGGAPWPPSLVLGALLLVAVAGAAVSAGAITTGTPQQAAGPPLRPPAPGHWLGTDDLGRDVFTRVVYGGRVSLLVGVTVAVTSAAIGTAVGAAAGYFGGAVDDVLMRMAETVQVVPRFFLAIVVAALFGNRVWVIGVLLGVTFWPVTARLLRAQILSVREREFVVAARALGAPQGRILWRHVLPHALPVVLTSAALQVGAAMLVEAGLSFLGLGDPSAVSWGAMLNGAQNFVRAAWWMSLFPGLAIMVSVMGANLLADGLQDVLNPRRPQRRGGWSGRSPRR